MLCTVQGSLALKALLLPDSMSQSLRVCWQVLSSPTHHMGHEVILGATASGTGAVLGGSPLGPSPSSVGQGPLRPHRLTWTGWSSVTILTGVERALALCGRTAGSAAGRRGRGAKTPTQTSSASAPCTELPMRLEGERYPVLLNMSEAADLPWLQPSTKPQVIKP